MGGDNDGVLTGGGQNEALKQNLGIDKCGKKDEPFDGLWVVEKRKNTRWQILASVSTGQSTPPASLLPEVPSMSYTCSYPSSVPLITLPTDGVHIVVV